MQDYLDTEPRGLDRRAALKAALGGAAAAGLLAGPRIEGFSLAPDYAAAASCPVIDMGFGTATGQNGWSQTISGTFENTPQNLGVGTNWWSLGSGVYAHIVERNNIAAMTVTYSRTVSLNAGNTYTFSFQSSGTVTNPVTQTLVATLRNPSNAVVGSTSFTTADPGRTNGWLQTHSFSVPVTVTGTYTFTYTHSAPARSGSAANDDIGVTAPAVGCAPTPP